MTQSQRTFLAAAVAPLAPTSLLLLAQLAFAPLALTWLWLSQRWFGHPRLGLLDPTLSHVLVGSAVGGYVLSYALGTPACLVLRRLQRTRWYAYLTGAFLAGALAVSLALLWVTFPDPSWPMAELGFFSVNASAYVSIYAFGLVAGMLTASAGLLFWLIARPDRPVA